MDIKKETLYQSIAYFVKHTDNCYLTKLLKLIYFFDLEHIRAIGIPATNEKYNAWDKGPVIEELRKKIVQPDDEEFNKYFDVKVIEDGFSEKYLIKAKFDLDEDTFSEVQLNILKNLSNKFKTANANVLIEETHKPNDPWHIVYEINKQKNAQIPLEIGNDDEETLKARLDLHGRF